jgi:hypothetical protein
MATSSPYRRMYVPSTNVSSDRRLIGVFSLATTTGGGLGTFVRPSTSLADAAAGLGNMFTVTQPTGSTSQYLVTFSEKQLQPVFVYADLVLQANTGGTDGTPPSPPPYTAVTPYAVCTAVDQGSHSFYITLLNPTTGEIDGGTTSPPTGFTWLISFEACEKALVAPTSL